MRHLSAGLAGSVLPCFCSCMSTPPLLVRRRHIDLVLVAASLCPGGPRIR
ncbi:hypothetical protein MXD60_23585 [Frankia sp. AgB32]|nr:hypothetical protein [Frankia sp. AgB32]